jgi:hypothetical protein
VAPAQVLDRLHRPLGTHTTGHDAELARLRAERDRLKALSAEPGRRDEQLTGELYAGIYQALPAWERGAWLKSHGFVIHATKKEVSVIQGDVRGTAHLG